MDTAADDALAVHPPASAGALFFGAARALWNAASNAVASDAPEFPAAAVSSNPSTPMLALSDADAAATALPSTQDVPMDAAAADAPEPPAAAVSSNPSEPVATASPSTQDVPLDAVAADAPEPPAAAVSSNTSTPASSDAAAASVPLSTNEEHAVSSYLPPKHAAPPVADDDKCESFIAKKARLADENEEGKCESFTAKKTRPN